MRCQHTWQNKSQKKGMESTKELNIIYLVARGKGTRNHILFCLSLSNVGTTSSPQVG